MTTVWRALAALLVLVACSCFASADDDLASNSCEGFVRFPAGLETFKDLDLTRLEVVLTNEQGHVKDRAQFTPNGYYALPVYDSGVFRLRIVGPPGWNFEPSEVRIVNGLQGKRTCAEGDVNFAFAGFLLTGQVVAAGGVGCEEAAAGVAGVSVTLTALSETDGAKVVDTRVTDKTGAFTFSRVVPGTYRITPTRAREVTLGEVNANLDYDHEYDAAWVFEPSHTDVTVVGDTVQLSQPLVASGFTILGNVGSDGEPLRGVEVVAHQGSANDAEVGRATSDENGVYRLSGLPCGKYTLVPHLKGFQVAPKELALSVGNNDVIVKQAFQFLGFAAKGSVRDVHGRGVAGVQVTLRKSDGSKTVTATTDTNGNYIAEHLSVGQYTLTATKPKHTFQTLTDVQVTPAKESLPTVLVSGYTICGRIVLDSTWSAIRQITLRGDGKKFERTQRSDATGEFCFDSIAPGKYQVSPQIEAKERQQGLALYPTIHSLTVDSEPLSNVVFSQALVNVRGTVKCLASCPAQLTVHLSAIGRNAKKEAAIDAGANFEFTGVLPGKYTVQIVKEDWCWEEALLHFEVSEDDVEGLELVQTGFKMPYTLSHEEIPVVIEHSKKSEKALETVLKKGDKHLCLPRSGAYRVTPKSCFRFDEESYHFSTDKPQTVELHATAFLVSGTVVVPKDFDKGNDIFIHSTVVKTKEARSARAFSTKKDAGDADPAHSVVTAKFTKLRKDKKQEFQFSYWAQPGEQLEFTPKANTLLFYPESRKISVPEYQCPQPVDAFEGKDGMYVQGSVVPALADVHVSIFYENTEAASAVTTNAQGEYRIGPLYEGRDYQIRLHKKGYVFSAAEGSTTTFEAQRLSTIVVRVLDETSRAPLAGVFVSLSGSTYRNNTVTRQDGEQDFINLPPGDFFLRTQLKEYVFEPPSRLITLEEGQLQEVEVLGKRTAFSCFGRITTLNGQPESGVAVEAVSADGHYEETRTDSKGLFRLRGLVPKVEYTVRVRSETSQDSSIPAIERTLPESVRVTVLDSDVHDQHFIAFESPETFDIVGTIDTDAEWLENLEVQLVTPGAGAVQRSARIFATKYFEITGVKFPSPHTPYVLRLSANLPKHKITRSSEIKVTPFRNPTTILRVVEVSLSFQAELRQDAHQITSTPFFSLVIAVGGICCVYNWKAFSEFVGKYLGSSGDRRRR
eukprot:TRINITY_DN1415_c0_g1_i1.p1 TRINITY_DN1415_c0_g1~~TRINITY_DN1415_c0_g1_i1.p1  ORF type:complete len:1194 (-),score=237.09 TRINITY_DN1415_c0_g1_i1:264-3824(-)